MPPCRRSADDLGASRPWSDRSITFQSRALNLGLAFASLVARKIQLEARIAAVGRIAAIETGRRALSGTGLATGSDGLAPQSLAAQGGLCKMLLRFVNLQDRDDKEHRQAKLRTRNRHSCRNVRGRGHRLGKEQPAGGRHAPTAHGLRRRREDRLRTFHSRRGTHHAMHGSQQAAAESAMPPAFPLRVRAAATAWRCRCGNPL